MPRLPSKDAIAATLELRRWSRRQERVTGSPPSPETVAGRIARHYGKLAPYDRAYVEQFAIPTRPGTTGFLQQIG